MSNKKWHVYIGESYNGDWYVDFNKLEPMAQEIILHYFPNLPIIHKGKIQNPERLLVLSIKKTIEKGLVEAKTCGRCGGTGRCSFNPVHGSMCYGCDGIGKIAPSLAKIHSALFANNK